MNEFKHMHLIYDVVIRLITFSCSVYPCSYFKQTLAEEALLKVVQVLFCDWPKNARGLGKWVTRNTLNGVRI